MEREKTPRHVAIIMDGNGRWAEARGRERIHGHAEGVESIRRTVKAALDRGVETLTLYAFSTENWGRPQAEVEGLMDLFCRGAVRETPELKARGVRIRFIGDVEAMSESIRRAVAYCEEETRPNDRLTLVIALNYSARWEIARAARQIAAQAAAGALDPAAVTADELAGHLTTAGMPDPDLIVRTSGEYRLSNFLLWQAAYSEFYFTEVLWPDFDAAEFDRALEAYAARKRRYGKI
jgi:undecaprenyl diphosphate synthase